jgi:hypothetical protein
MRMLGGYGTATGKPARHGYVVARSSNSEGEGADTSPGCLAAADLLARP